MKPTAAMAISQVFGRLNILSAKNEKRPNTHTITGRMWIAGVIELLYFAGKVHQIYYGVLHLNAFPVKDLAGFTAFAGPLKGNETVRRRV